MSVFALNLFDLAENDLYRQYSRRSVDAVGKHGGRVVALGKLSTDASAGVPVSILSAAFAHGVCSVSRRWAGLDSNQGATDYESAALPLSYRPAGRTLAASAGQAVLGEALGDREQHAVGNEAAGERMRLVDRARDDGARAGGHGVDGLAGDVARVEDEEARELALEAAGARDLGELGLGETRAQDGDRDAGAAQLGVD